MADAPLSRLTHDVVQDTYKVLHALLDSLSETDSDSSSSTQRRTRLLDFVLSMRHRFVRLLVIVRWFMDYSAFHGSAHATRDLAFNHSHTFSLDADTLFYAHTALTTFSTTPCALADAAHILGQRNYLFRLPRIIENSLGIDVTAKKFIALSKIRKTNAQQLKRPLMLTDGDDKVDVDVDVDVSMKNESNAETVLSGKDGEQSEQTSNKSKIESKLKSKSKKRKRSSDDNNDNVIDDNQIFNSDINSDINSDSDSDSNVNTSDEDVDSASNSAAAAAIAIADDDDDDDDDEDDVTDEALLRLKLHTRRVVSDHLPLGVSIIRHSVAPRGVAIRIGVPNAWTADVILDSLSETSLRLLSLSLLIDGDPDAPTLMHSRLRSRERALPLTRQHLSPLREMLDDRMRWACFINQLDPCPPPPFHVRIRNALSTLAEAMSLDCCGSLAMAHVREQTGALMQLRVWREGNMEVSGRWNERSGAIQQQQVDKGGGDKKNLGGIGSGSGKNQPVCIWYWTKSYLRSSISFQVCLPPPPPPKEIAKVIALKGNAQEEPKEEDVQQNKLDIIPTRILSIEDDDDHCHHPFRRIIDIVHDPMLPELHDSAAAALSSSSSTSSSDINPIEKSTKANPTIPTKTNSPLASDPVPFDVSSINVQHTISESARLRAVDELAHIADMLTHKADVISSISKPRYLTSVCSWGGLTIIFPGTGDVGLVVGVSLSSGGVFIRARGALEPTLTRNGHLGANLRHMIWPGERFFRSRMDVCNTLFHIVAEAAAVATHCANVRATIAAGLGASVTWPVNRSIQPGDKDKDNNSSSMTSGSQYAQKDKNASYNENSNAPNLKRKRHEHNQSHTLHPSLVPPFVPLERKFPRSFMTLDSVAPLTIDAGDAASHPVLGANKHVAKRARTSSGNAPSSSSSGAATATGIASTSSFGLAMRRVGDLMFVQAQNKVADAMPPRKFAVSATDIATWSELRHEVRSRMLREKLLTLLMEGGVISSWRGREQEQDEEEEDGDEEDEEKDKEMGENEDDVEDTDDGNGDGDDSQDDIVKMKDVGDSIEAQPPMKKKKIEQQASNDNELDNAHCVKLDSNIDNNNKTMTHSNLDSKNNKNNQTNNNNPTNNNTDSLSNNTHSLTQKRKRVSFAAMAAATRTKPKPITPSRATNEAIVQMRSHPLDVTRAYVRIFDDESWELEVRLASDIFSSSSPSDNMLYIAPVYSGEANYIGGNHHILRFHYAAISGASVRGCIREVMRARAALTLSLGLAPDKSERFVVVRRTHQYVVAHCSCGILLQAGLGVTAIEVKIQPRPYPYPYSPPKNSTTTAAGVAPSIGNNPTNTNVAADKNKQQQQYQYVSPSAFAMLQNEIIPLVEEVLSESRKQMGVCLAAVLNVTIPMAVAIERAVGRDRQQRTRTKIKFVSVLRARIFFVIQLPLRKIASASNSSQKNNASPSTTASKNSANKQTSQAQAQTQSSSSASASNSTASAVATTPYIFALDVDGHNLNGRIILTDVGRLRRHRQQQQTTNNAAKDNHNNSGNDNSSGTAGTSVKANVGTTVTAAAAGTGPKGGMAASAAASNSNNNNSGSNRASPTAGGGSGSTLESNISTIPTWKLVVEQLTDRNWALSLNHGNSVEMKLDILYKVVNAIVKSVAGSGA